MAVREKGNRRTWKSEEFRGIKPTVYDWCRLAAFLDGEGCLRIDVSGKRSIIKVTVTGTSEDLMLWLCETFGGNFWERSGHKKNKNHSVAYNWDCSAARGAWLLWNCKVWMIIKPTQADLLLEYQETLDATVQFHGMRLDDGVQQWRALIKEEIHRLNARGPKKVELQNMQVITGE